MIRRSSSRALSEYFSYLMMNFFYKRILIYKGAGHNATHDHRRVLRIRSIVDIAIRQSHNFTRTYNIERLGWTGLITTYDNLMQGASRLHNSKPQFFAIGRLHRDLALHFLLTLIGLTRFDPGPIPLHCRTVVTRLIRPQIYVPKSKFTGCQV